MPIIQPRVRFVNETPQNTPEPPVEPETAPLKRVPSIGSGLNSLSQRVSELAARNDESCALIETQTSIIKKQQMALDRLTSELHATSTELKNTKQALAIQTEYINSIVEG